MMNLKKLCKICEALSNPIRVHLYIDLMEEPKSIYEIAKKFKVSRPVIYAHLKKLEDANLVENEMKIEGGRAKKIYKALPIKLVIDAKILKKYIKGVSPCD